MSWQLVHLLVLVCSFQWCVLFLCLAKLYRSYPIRDKDLFTFLFPIQNPSYLYRVQAVYAHMTCSASKITMQIRRKLRANGVNFWSTKTWLPLAWMQNTLGQFNAIFNCVAVGTIGTDTTLKAAYSMCDRQSRQHNIRLMNHKKTALSQPES